ncbi:MAG: hypothetical protein L0322_32035 [Chloroflexi bacterium]|nr:hypothetical protein [Chloroflexota bacterium]MCI0579273.1 hypothetical protein [Chloroflexota bacterium]MCI0647441.1 hypothetical protein [Chloroflexota bacterium]
MRFRRVTAIGLVVALLVLGVVLLGRTGELGPESAARQEGLVQLLAPGRAVADFSDDPDFPLFAEGVIDEQTYLMLRDEQVAQLHGIPHTFAYNARTLAIQQMEQQEAALRGAELLMPTWVEMGPAPIPNGQTTSVSTPVSGRTIAIAIHPTDPDIVYVGTAQGGLYRTLDGGTTWTQLMDNALSLAIGAVAIAPSNPSTVFVGTGESHSSCDSFFGVGVYRITNADTSPLVEGPFNLDGGANDVFTGRAISRILVHPADANTIFVGSYSGIGGIGCAAPVAPPSAGLFRSTNALSGSPTFSKLTVATDNGGNNRVTDMIFEPGTPATMLVGIRAFTGPSGGGIYRTTNALDPSPTFSKTLDVNDTRIEFAINKVGATVTVIAATGESSGTLRRSTDGGVTWPATLPSATGFCGGQCWYDIGLAMDPANANVIYVGGASNSGAARVLAKTTNGSTFTDIDTGLHADTHAIVLAPSNANILYVGSDGGIWRSTNAGGNFTSLNNSQFSATQFQSVALHPVHPTFMIGGTQDNGTECLGVCGSNVDPNAWIRADFGDGGFALIDQNATNTTLVTMYHTYFNIQGAMGYAKVTATASAQDNGWTLYGCGFAGSIPNGFDCTDLVNFYAPMALGPGNPNTAYFGSNVLYRSANGGVTMSVVSQDPFDAAAGANGRVSAIGISPQNDSVRIVGLRNGKVFATTTGSTTLANVTPAGAPAAYVGRVVIDPNDSNTAYIAYAGFGVPAGQHVWKTTNLAGGAGTWVAAGSGIPDVPISAFVVDPADANILYAGTDIGVYQSTNGGTSWAPYGTGLPRVAVFDMAIHNGARKLRIATHGRGIWEIDLGNAAPNINQLSKTAAAGGPLVPSVTLTYTVQVVNSGGLTGTAVVTDTFPAGLSSPTCVGYDAAAGYNNTGDLQDTVDIPGFDQATYVCTTQVDSPVLDVSTTVTPTTVDAGETVTYTIVVTNVGNVDLTGVTVADPDIPAGNCDTNPTTPFTLVSGEVKTFVCPVVADSSVTNTTTATGMMTITNTATVSGTSAILVDSAVVDVTATATDQASVTVSGSTVYLPLIRREGAAAVPW